MLLLGSAINAFAQQKTDVSLFLKKDNDVYLDSVETQSGNMFNNHQMLSCLILLTYSRIMMPVSKTWHTGEMQVVN